VAIEESDRVHLDLLFPVGVIKCQVKYQREGDASSHLRSSFNGVRQENLPLFNQSELFTIVEYA
jgi:hypothetical protein